ncbi:hypothetical protein GLAREA_12897 [Glarea lozoyensis ATCC 20868]|uniref:BZIP domain-containing protein n=1 Tax=Glarea lozoyensis (strain ATCC 20868 / MF5171) TaxID=1116229 RepID=S3CZ23_GLAL2|nr:uncharacterized protein GLAREA_12897 [Glarea lozoyensis ATCC 20868]EPE30174.1 hypothetical protein GLAREA_12897 [Glarea lozoyensis ATCC 20868]
MSQNPSASRPASRSPTDGHRTALPSIQVRDDLRQAGRPVERQRPVSAGRGFQGQPSPQRVRDPQPARPVENWRGPGASRDLGVHSILNPSEPEPRSATSQRPGGSIAGSPLSVVGPLFGASPSRTISNTFPSLQPASTTPPTAEGYPAPYPQPRRILTPRSPSRSLSSSRGRGRGTIDAQRSPFLPSRGRAYTTETEQLSGSPPIPATTQSQQHYGFPSSANLPEDRRTSMPSMNDPRLAPLSQSASPSVSASSLNPSSAQTSPASFLYSKSGPGQAPAQSSSYFPGSSFATSVNQTPGSGGIEGMQYQGTPEGPYSAPASQTPGGSSSLNSNNAGSSRQTSASDPIQVLTITTSSGQYQVPVDVHQASKLADEKRARNAGASARFRQRRKEKEKDASISIEKLQTNTRELERRLRETEQERDFYRSERDRFRDVVFRTPDMRHLAMQTPPSPRTLRGGTSFAPPGQQLAGPTPPTQGFNPHPQPSMNDTAPRRRRINTQGDYATSPYSNSPPSTLPPVQNPGYATGPPQGSQNLPPLRLEPPQATTQSIVSTGPPSATLGPQQHYPPYAGRQGPYDPARHPPPGDSKHR